MEETLQNLCVTKMLPGVVLAATDRSGSFSYFKALGLKSLQSDEPLTTDAIMDTKSCTKLFTTIAAMQCVERGLVTLDEDLRSIMTAFADLDIVTADEKDRYKLIKNTKPITLRHLLTHTSGFAYDMSSPLLQRWRGEQQAVSMDTIEGRYKQPLVFEPGANWTYGPSLDWTGVVIKHLTGLKLEEYIQQNICEPLGIDDMTFFLSQRPDLHDRIMHMSFRVSAEDSVTHADAVMQICFQPDMKDALGGEGMFTSATSYLKVLQALLRATGASASDANPPPPTQLVRKSTATAIFEPQLHPTAVATIQTVCQNPWMNRIMGNMPVETHKNWGLGGLLCLDDLHDWRKKGTMSWGGFPNLSWWIDCEAGLCGIFATQLLPAGDEKTVEMIDLFQKTMYKRLAAIPRL